MVFGAFRTRSVADPAVRAGARLALGLLVAQMTLGICNVFLGTPPWLSALHLATATMLLGILVTVTYRVAGLPARAARLVPAAS